MNAGIPSTLRTGTSEGNYHCTDCGQKYSVTDAVAEQDGYGLSLYALEYYCGTCDDQGKNVPQ